MPIVTTAAISHPPMRPLLAAVRTTHGAPVLMVNGRPESPCMLFVNLHDVPDPRNTAVMEREIRLAARRGVRIVSFTVGLPWPREGEQADYSHAVDRWVEVVLRANPNALLLPRVPTTWPPDWWTAAHPGEIMLYDDGRRHTASVHSAIWRRDAARHLTGLVRHMEARYGDRVLGYHPSGQHTGEWFYDRMWEGRLSGYEACARDGFRAWLRRKYRSDARLQRAWRSPEARLAQAEPPDVAERTSRAGGLLRDPAVDQRAIDFDAYQNEAMADAVDALCAAVKRAAPSKLAVAFYGYTFGVAPAPHGLASTGHVALGRLLRSRNVDVLCSPVSYQDRGPGGGGYLMAPVDSVHLHRKLWLTEDDTRTHLSPDSPDSIGRARDARESLGVLERNWAHTASRGAAVWWMDLPGEGWFDDEALWELLGRLHGAHPAVEATVERYAPEIAVVVDESSALFTAPSPEPNAALLERFRREWYRIGAPAGIYLLDDLLQDRVPRGRMTIVLNAFSLSLAQVARLHERFRATGGVVVWMAAPGLIRDGVADLRHVADVTGVRLRERSGASGRIRLRDGSLHEAGAWAGRPSITIDDPAAEALAWFADGSGVAVAAARRDGYLSVTAACLSVPARLLANLAERAGAHLTAPPGDIVAAGNGIVALHACTPGRKTIALPQDCEVRDIVTGEALGRLRKIERTMASGDTCLVRVRPAPKGGAR